MQSLEITSKLLGKTRFLKLKNSPLEFEKYFIEFKDRELKNIEVKIKREIEVLFLNRLSCLQIIWTSLNQKMKKKRLIKNTSYNRLINCIPEPIRKIVDEF